MNVKRRTFLSHLTGLALYSVAQSLHARATPPQSLGPFYPLKIPLDSNADLTFVEGSDGVATGEVTNLFGRVIDSNGVVIPDAQIEIWQCDAFGAYHHPHAGGGIDPFFQGYGATISDAQGRYRFRTIKPVTYPGRAPHIHMKITAGTRELVTQIYVRGEPANYRDFLLGAIKNSEARNSLIIPFERNSSGAPDELDAVFNPVLKA
jgi:protocatechuate 3,4-dioxygenase beta subunit